MSTISQIMGINIRPPSSLFSLLPLYEVLLMCKRPYQSFERPAHWPCDRSMKLLSVKPPMTNLWISFLLLQAYFGQRYLLSCFFSSPVKMSSSTSWNRNNTTMMTTTKRTKVVEEEPNNCNNQQQMATTATKLRGYLQVKQNPTTRRSRLPRKVHNTIILHTGFIKEAKSFTICGFHLRAKFICLITKGSNPMINNITMRLSFIITIILQ